MKSKTGEPEPMASATIPATETSELLSRLYAEHHRRVLRAAWRITGSMADAEDVAQSVFLRLLSGDGRAMTNPASYLYRAAINGALDLLRRRRTAAAESLDAAADLASTRPGGLPEAEVSNRELGQWLRSAIGELSPRAAEMFALRYLEELGNREIAQCMGTSQAVVAVTLHQARAKLKKRLIERERRNR